MNRDYYFREVCAKLYPILRAEGFRGSGATLRRIQLPVIHVFNFQASSGGECCYINLGCHLNFLPTEGGGVCDPKKIAESSCAFRERVDPPAGSAFGWQYGASESAAKDSVAALVEYWRCYGRPFFERHTKFPDDFMVLVEKAVVNQPHPIDGLKFARLALRLDRSDLALALASQAVPHVPERATDLRDELDAFIKSIQSR
jgi:hypothetical protein